MSKQASPKVAEDSRTPRPCGTSIRPPFLGGTLACLVGLLLGAVFLSGCASAPRPGTRGHLHPRPFDFSSDTFSYANELLWVYHYDNQGNWSTEVRDPKPGYSLHCFVVARAALQFFEHARFDPSLPLADEATYRKLIRKVARTSLRQSLPPEERVVIPAYANLREFSSAREDLLKEECGAAYQSYFQRGHWRMIFPFSRRHQEIVARELVQSLDANCPAVVHVAQFPSLRINHAIVVFGYKRTAAELRFAVYDPNEPGAPTTLAYDRLTRRFDFPPNKYFLGGRVDAYRVYHAWIY